MSRMTSVKALGAVMLAAMTIAAPVSAQLQPSTKPVVDPAAAAKLTASLQSAVSALPANAAQADVEAALVFAIDQSGQSADVAVLALNSLDESKLSPSARSAVASVRNTRARLAQRGTGSIAGGPGIGLAFGSALSINGGSSGTSDYNR